MARHCLGDSTIQRKKSFEQRVHLAMPTVTCSARGIRAGFGPLVKNNVRVRDLSGITFPVLHSEGSCGVKMDREDNQNLSFFSRYDSCYAYVEGRKVFISLLVQLIGDSQWLKVNISCPLIKRSKEQIHPKAPSEECSVDKSLRIDCGHQSISSDACNKLGCCYDAHASNCYYKLNACSLDGHFVFTIKATDTHPPIDPRSLVIKDQPHCVPALTTPDTAVFKIGVTECGAKMKKDGDLVLYEVEVDELDTRSKNRYSQFNLQVQCEYEESDLKRAKDLHSLYIVTNPPPVIGQGTIGLQMRIATDSSFTSFIPEDQLPLTLPLRKAVYVEISIVQPSPDPTLSLRVRDCFAYPASKHSVWTLLHNGCPNPLDTMRSSVPVDNQGKTSSLSQVRRFDIKTFAFLDPKTGVPSMEEMYFYCWVEICTDDVECAQPCAITSSEVGRQRRQASPEHHQVQLVSTGPLVQNQPQVDDDWVEKQNTMFQLMYTLSGVALLLILLFILWSTSKCQKRGHKGFDVKVHSEQSQ
ncbi:zona pellucida sperm-binding protein 4-like [Cololabis saira]|uniref:zona pellucida sperm-binding protein 4-like n=1 Tax=Cololabis saira TaxID=129043 RepID=UPI002AD2E376|nr:zona pellucida sperm-binding protein 4-like [Cololabis saira]